MFNGPRHLFMSRDVHRVSLPVDHKNVLINLIILCPKISLSAQRESLLHSIQKKVKREVDRNWVFCKITLDPSVCVSNAIVVGYRYGLLGLMLCNISMRGTMRFPRGLMAWLNESVKRNRLAIVIDRFILLLCPTGIYHGNYRGYRVSLMWVYHVLQ